MGFKNGSYRLLKIAGQEKFKLLLSCLFSILGSIMIIVPLIIVYLIGNELLQANSSTMYIRMLVVIAGAAVICKFVFQYFSLVFSHIAAYNILYLLRKKLARHLGTLPLGFFTRQSAGGLKKILNEDIEEIELFIAHHIPDIVTAIILPLLSLVFLFSQNWFLALISLIPLPLAFLVQRIAFQDTTNLTMQYNKSLENMNGSIVEYVRGMPVIKIFNQTVNSFKKYSDAVSGFKNLCISWSNKSLAPYALFTVLITSSIFFVLPAGAWLIIQKHIDISMLFLFLLIGIGYIAPLLRIAGYNGKIGQISAGVIRIESILAEQNQQLPATPRSSQHHTLEFKKVTFAYDKKNVLTDISFKSPAGTVTALVGPSGSGKSTIAMLIPRFWDIGQGEITIGGVNIKDMAYDVLMKNVSFVFQNEFLFNDTIMENIKMGNTSASEADVLKAATAAQAHEFIMKLPRGYKTVYGSEGVHLSGGEIQRIALARSILRDSPIIVLDEATAFADAENEVKIQKALNKLMKNKTVIVIAHRLYTIKDADNILVVDNGQIIESGTHNQLLKENGLYKRMWDAHIDARDWEFGNKGVRV